MPDDSSEGIAAGAGAASNAGARILVVDDSAVSRRKLCLALGALGHQAAGASSGEEGLALARDGDFEVILLDIVMPGLDGYEVLDALRSDAALSQIPVIVISSLEEETESVVRAIDLGAEDFLPKDFDSTILRARLNASLRKKRIRDWERSYRSQVDRLTEAAIAMESEIFRPEMLTIGDLAQRADSLGRLARVFVSLANELYQREARLRRRIRMLTGTLLVLLVGMLWGLTAPLSRMAADLDAPPLGLAVWKNMVGLVLFFGAAACLRRLGWPSRAELRFCLQWGLLVGVFQTLALFWITAHVEASAVALISTLEGFMVCGVVIAIGAERITRKRLIGLALGCAGTVLILFSSDSVTGESGLLWLAAATILPFLYAVEGVTLADRRPKEMDMLRATALMHAIAFLFTLPAAVGFGDPMPIEPRIGALEIIVLLIGIAGAVVTWLSFKLAAIAGAVFASQVAYSGAIAGVVWSMLLLDERLSVLAWIALGLMLLGLWFVEPRDNEDDRLFRLPISRS